MSKSTLDKAICYLRVSTEEQAREGVSLAAQHEKLTTYCKLANLEPTFIQEEGVSAAKPLATRPGGAKLLSLIAQKRTGNVVTLKLDRLFRDAEDALHQTKAWDKAGVALHLVDMGGQTINTATAMGRFFLNVMAGFAELERNLIAERTETALAHKRANLEAYAPTPYGYDRVDDRLTLNPTEQGVIKRVLARRRAGASLGKIAQELTDLGIPTKRGRRWYPSTVAYILRNTLYEGAA